MHHSIQGEPDRFGVDFTQIILSFRKGRVWCLELLWSSIISPTCSRTRVLGVQRFPNPLSTQTSEEQLGLTVDSHGMQEVDVALNGS